MRDFDLPGAVAVIGGLATLVYGISATESHGWWSVPTVLAFTVSATLLVTFLKLEQRAAKPLFPPHVWKLKALVSGTAVMLGVTGILVGTVFLTSIFLQTVLGFSALETGLAFLPFALAITAGTLVARHLLAHLSPRVIATVGLLITVAASLWLSTADAGAHLGTDILPALSALGLGVGMVFVPVSVTSMTGIPDSHAGVASGFLMTGHEVGAALGVAVLSAVASAAGSLTTAAGAAEAFSAGFIGAAVMGAVVRGLRTAADARRPGGRRRRPPAHALIGQNGCGHPMEGWPQRFSQLDATSRRLRCFEQLAWEVRWIPRLTTFPRRIGQQALEMFSRPAHIRPSPRAARLSSGPTRVSATATSTPRSLISTWLRWRRTMRPSSPSSRQVRRTSCSDRHVRSRSQVARRRSDQGPMLHEGLLTVLDGGRNVVWQE